MGMITNLIGKNKKMQNVALGIVKQNHLLADPHKYFRCNKREINPSVFLEDKYLEHSKLISSREKLLEQCEKGKVWAEVGVAEGYFSDKILKICNPEKLYMIEYGAEYVSKLEERFCKEIKEGKVQILQGDSCEKLADLRDNELDYVFLDATHDYEHPAKELALCKDKVRDSGWIMGHDYTRFSMWEAVQYGVVEAVNEFCIKNSYRFVYLTMDILHSNASYALKNSSREKVTCLREY